MLVKSVTFNRAGGVSRFAAEFSKAASPEKIFTGQIALHADVEPPETPGDPFLAAALLPAMYLGEDLEIRAPVNARLVQSVATVQDIFLSWYPEDLHRISLRLPEVRPDPAKGAECNNPATACFFSGGADSWYSLLKHQDSIRALVTVKGFDIRYDDRTVWPELVAANSEIAAEFGMELLTVETNLRDFLDPSFPEFGKQFHGDFWGPFLHGAFLGAVGLCLPQLFARVIIPATYPYQALHQWGSHPLVDPLWSTSRTVFEHDGCEASRTVKLRRVAMSASALRHLRVCANNAAGRYNCGECEKCLRTMLALHLLGCLERTSSFGKGINLELLAMLRLPPERMHWYRELLAEAEDLGHAEVIRLLRVLLGEQRSWRREWGLLRAQSVKAGTAVLRISGLPRHLRSLRKRWNQMRGMSPSS